MAGKRMTHRRRTGRRTARGGVKPHVTLATAAYKGKWRGGKRTRTHRIKRGGRGIGNIYKGIFGK